MDIRKNPDCSIHLVLERCKAMLVACKPWFRPSVLSRTWCLYECMLAVQAVSEPGKRRTRRAGVRVCVVIGAGRGAKTERTDRLSHVRASSSSRATQGVELVALNLDPSISLDTVFIDNEIERAEESIDDALIDLDIRNGNTVQKMDHTTILSMVGAGWGCAGGQGDLRRQVCARGLPRHRSHSRVTPSAFTQWCCRWSATWAGPRLSTGTSKRPSSPAS